MGGLPVEHVIAGLSGRPAKIVAPDPRLFALHKWMMAVDPNRKPAKQRKDHNQALQVKRLIELGMPHHPFDDEFLDNVSPLIQQSWKSLSSFEDKSIIVNEHKSTKRLKP